MATAKLTKRYIDSLMATASKYTVYDTELKGFGLTVFPSGTMTYIFEYRPDGGGRRVDKKRMALARVGEVTPDQARGLARDKASDVRRGLDPLADRQSKRQQIKVHELIDQWDAASPISKRTGRPMGGLTKPYTLARLRNHVVPLLGNKRVIDITVEDVNDFIRRVTKGETARDEKSDKKRGRIRVRGGQGAARKVASDFSMLMVYAIEDGIIHANPVTHARKPRAGKRYDFLSVPEFTAIGLALEDLLSEGANPTGISILRLIMLTGARPGEIEGLKWDEVDLQGSCLRLTGSKTGYSIRPLSRAAIDLLKTLTRTKSPYVFPASRGEGYFRGAKKIWNKARTKANLPNRVRYHARHALATIALSEGIDAVSVAAMMGHKGPRTTLAVYAHVLDENAARAAENIGGKIAAAMTIPAGLDPFNAEESRPSADI